MLQNQKYKVKGMSCAACSSSVESILNTISEINKAEVNFATQSVTIQTSVPISIKELNSKLEPVGFGLYVGSENENTDLSNVSYYKLIVAAVFGLPVFVVGMFWVNMPFGKELSCLFTLPVLFYSGSNFFINTYHRIQKLVFDMDTLVASGTGVAFILSCYNILSGKNHVYFESVVVVIGLILLGKYLEEKAQKRTSDTVAKLLDLNSKKAWVVFGGKEYEMDLSEVQKGDTVVVKTGEKIPIDAEVLKGASYVDEKMISGEPIPRSVTIGDQVIGGTINQSSVLTIKATAVGNETVLSRIALAVENAQSSRAPIQNVVDRIASIFVPSILLISLLTFIFWQLVNGNTEYAIIKSATVLIVACPCALGLATPLAIIAGIGKGASLGILIKEASSLQKAKKVNILVLDKTGTITNGKPQIVDSLISTNDENIIYALERTSTHPISKTIAKFVGVHDDVFIEEVKEVPGFGVEAKVNGKVVKIGSVDFFKNDVITDDIQKKLIRNKTKPYTVVLFGYEGRVTSSFFLFDEIKKEAIDILNELRSRNIQTVISSGDNENAVRYVAEQLNVSSYFAGVKPEDKLSLITNFQDEGKKVAMIGDGINDAPALAQADFSMTFSNGSDIAIDAADVTFLGSSLERLNTVFSLSKKTITTIKINLFWAFFYNILMIPLAMGVFASFGFEINPMIAGASMAISSITVVLNSLRLRLT